MRYVALAGVLAVVVWASACDQDPLSAGVSCLETTSLDPGTPRNGRLERGDEVLDGSFVDYYAVRLGEPAELVVTLTSGEIDPFLYLLDEDRAFLKQAFDTEPLGPAMVTDTLDAGCYFVGASSWSERNDSAGTGLYRIVADTAS